MVETLPPKSPFHHLAEAERELDWHENHLRRRTDGSRVELGLLAFLAAATALLAALLWWWLDPTLATTAPTSGRSN